MNRKMCFDSLSYPPGFYPGDAEQLRSLIEGFRIVGEGPAEALGAIVPHAGLIYSGAVAKAVYDSCLAPATAVLLGPNHTGLGKPFALWSHGEWETPFGALKVDEAFGQDLLEACPLVETDAAAHTREHSLEVQTPFLALWDAQVRIVPVAIRSNDPSALERLGEALAEVIRCREEAVTIFASSDMSHYEPQEVAERKDRLALEKVLALDPKGLFRTVRDNNISMCGVCPATAMLHAAMALGADHAKVIAYRTSGDVTGDRTAVVGYAGVVVRRKTCTPGD